MQPVRCAGTMFSIINYLPIPPLVYNDYNFTFKGAQNNFKIKLASGIRDLSLKQDFDFYPFSKHKIKFGLLYTYHRFTPSVVSGQQDSVVFNPLNAQVKYAHEAALYVQDDWEDHFQVKSMQACVTADFNR